jgi:excisionase family DNA binding protein
MRKISIVSLRRERNKNLETAALIRARQRELGTVIGNVGYEHTIKKGVNERGCKFTDNLEEYSFDVVLSPEHIQKVGEHIQKQVTAEHDATFHSDASENHEIHPIIFRFNITPPEPVKTLTPDDVCNILKISRRTLYRYVKSNLLQCFRIGSQLRFLKQDIYHFLEQCKNKRFAN